MITKSIEIYYDIASIPGVQTGDLDGALGFRNSAMELVEAALEEAGAGEWDGAEIGRGEVNFGFSVDDFDKAEGIIRKAVTGTPFANIREIARNKFDPSSYQ